MASPRVADAEGRRALFTAASAGATTAASRGDGRRALFSVPEPAVRHDPMAVECHRCGARTPVSTAALARQLLPSWWVPLRRFPLLMRCPACRCAAWCRVLPARTTEH